MCCFLRFFPSDLKQAKCEGRRNTAVLPVMNMRRLFDCFCYPELLGCCKGVPRERACEMVGRMCSSGAWDSGVTPQRAADVHDYLVRELRGYKRKILRLNGAHVPPSWIPGYPTYLPTQTRVYFFYIRLLPLQMTRPLFSALTDHLTRFL